MLTGTHREQTSSAGRSRSPAGPRGWVRRRLVGPSADASGSDGGSSTRSIHDDRLSLSRRDPRAGLHHRARTGERSRWESQGIPYWDRKHLRLAFDQGDHLLSIVASARPSGPSRICQLVVPELGVLRLRHVRGRFDKSPSGVCSRLGRRGTMGWCHAPYPSPGPRVPFPALLRGAEGQRREPRPPPACRCYERSGPNSRTDLILRSRWVSRSSRNRRRSEPPGRLDDMNSPGASCPANGFQDRRLRPLGHPPAGESSRAAAPVCSEEF